MDEYNLSLYWRIMEFWYSDAGQVLLIVITILKAVAMGFVAAVIAEEKKKNKILWFFLGMFFGSIALVILMFITNDYKADDEGHIWICEQCDTENIGETCKNCGAPKSKIIV